MQQPRPLYFAFITSSWLISSALRWQTERTLRVSDPQNWIVKKARAVTAKPAPEASIKRPGLAATMPKAPVASIVGTSHIRAAGKSQRRHAGARYINPAHAALISMYVHVEIA